MSWYKTLHIMIKQFRRFIFHQYSKLVHYYYTSVRFAHLWRKYLPYYDQPHVLCIFAGYPRSGHTLIGALLNAHPEMLIAHELNLLHYVKAGYDRNGLFTKLIGQDKWFAARGNVWTGYSYKVKGQWQGRFRELKVIGDKRGGTTSNELYERPSLLDDLKQTATLPLKIIHIYRNPFDNIATRARGGNYYNRRVTPARLHQEIARHFQEVEAVENIRQKKQYDIYELSHEQFMADPRRHLTDMCRFLKVEPYEDYLDDSLRIIRKSRHKSRDKIQWDRQSIDAIYQHMAQYDFLKEYTFEE